MFANQQIVYQPAFYFLIALTLALTFGYTWGRRVNRRVLVNALDPLIELFEARDQQFTNIGGQTGFHANFVPGNMRAVRRIDTTITLLPRQSWLYLPFSLVLRRFDRMQVLFLLSKHGRALGEQAHLIDVAFEKMLGNRIEDADSLTREVLRWGGRTFHMYYAGETGRSTVLSAHSRMGEPSTLKHLAVVPQQERVYAFLVPKVGAVPPLIATLRDWLEEAAIRE